MLNLAFSVILLTADFSTRYKSTLDYSENMEGHSWHSEISDCWKLKSFRYAHQDSLELESGPGTVVFGKNGSNALWACFFPEQPGAIRKAPGGENEQFHSIYFRFHPTLVGEIFPSKSIQGPGEASQIVWARRIYQFKVANSWHNDNLPIVPQSHILVFDLETVEKNRRFYVVDEKEKRVKYEPALLGRRLPDLNLKECKPKEGAEILDQVWSAFDQEYAMFAIKPKVNWENLKSLYRPLAERATSYHEIAGILSLLLAHLEDLHVSVRIGEEWVWCYQRFRPGNADWKTILKSFPNMKTEAKLLSWAKNESGIGYVCIWGLNDNSLPDLFDQTLEQLKDTSALVFDLRMNGGGNETLAQLIAARFADKKRVYSLSQFRNGPKHGQLGPKQERSFEPRGAWRYEKPVVTLIGQKCMSSAESFALMMAQCPQVVTMGDRTAGSSGNPRTLELPGDIRVNLPRWIDFDLNGKPIDGVGIPPKVPVLSQYKDFKAGRDPALEAALQFLSEKN